MQVHYYANYADSCLRCHPHDELCVDEPSVDKRRLNLLLKIRSETEWEEHRNMTRPKCLYTCCNSNHFRVLSAKEIIGFANVHFDTDILPDIQYPSENYPFAHNHLLRV